MKRSVAGIYGTLLSHYGPQGWWPAGGSFRPREWEVCVGAVLTQNTSWKNVEKSLENLRKNNCVSVSGILTIRKNKLERLVNPSGFYKQKSKTLVLLANLVSTFDSFEDFQKKISREGLLKIKGIGPETADSILLYACNRPSFVVDAYTRRVFHRVGLVEHDWDYGRVKEYFEKNLQKDVSLYNEFHALIVRLGKEACRKKPLCNACPIERICKKRV